MIRKKIVLADEDEQYLKEIRYEFMEKAPQLELATFTKREKVYQYFEQGGSADILVVDEGLLDEKIQNMAASMTKIVLSTTMIPSEGVAVVKKYQRMESLLTTILLKYAENNGTLDVVCGNSNTRMAAFYSPAGGTGKTALALALAAVGARSGLRTLYLNLEEIDSVKDTLNRTSGCLSDIFLALKVQKMQAGIKLKESIGTEAASGFYYISGVESISEYGEISDHHIKRLLEIIRELSSYDLVILDQSSGFTEKTRRILEAADVIFTPVTEEEGSISKLKRFLEESNIHDEYDSLFGKMNLIINKAGVNRNSLEDFPDIIRNRLPCCASIATSPLLARRAEILQSGTLLLPLLNPLLQALLQGRNEVRR